MRAHTRSYQYLAGLALAISAILPASAATVSAVAANDKINIGESTSIDFFLNLSATEVASIFEGNFGIGGLGTVASATITGTGPTWPNAASNIVGGNATLSLTSNNLGDPTRLLATLNVTGLSAGKVDITFNDATFAAFDIPAFPFAENLVLGNSSGQVLASIAVVPEPSVMTLV
ncbi:MAG: hypothetical protein EOP38_02020, partial [Rubrivivax sp.]